MTFNGKDLSELITIQEVARNVGNERVIETNDAPTFGVNVKKVKTSAKIITLNFYMKNKFNKYALNIDKHTLAGIFNTSEPVKITFDDEPDKYYMGLVQGLPDFEDPIAWLSVISLEIIVPDGVAHSTTYSEFTDYTFETVPIDVDNGKNILNNGGGEFKPNNPPNVEFGLNGYYDNYEYYVTTNVHMRANVTYALKASTDGEFTNIHNGAVASNRVTLWLAGYKDGKQTGVYQLISDSNTAKQTNFKWTRPSGNYILRVNTYQRSEDLGRKVWDVKIVETSGDITIPEKKNIIKMPIVNNGNVPAKPIITLETKSDNGYYGLVNSLGASAIGNPDAQDGFINEKAVTIFDYRPEVMKTPMTTALAEAKKNVAPVNDAVDSYTWGNNEVQEYLGRQHIKHVRPTGASTYMGASSLTYEVPLTHSDYVWWRQVFMATSEKQMGMIKVFICDEENKLLYGVETIKRSLTSQAEYNLLIGKSDGTHRIAKRKGFQAANLKGHNPFREETGQTFIARDGKTVKFYFNGVTESIYVPEIEERRTKYVHVIFQNFTNFDTVGYMDVDGLQYTNNRAWSLVDLPNRYSIGDVTILNSENKTIQQNGVYDISQKVVGSDFIEIPVGESVLEIYTSAWSADLPNITVSFEERNL